MLFGIFLGFSFPFAQNRTVHRDFHIEGLIVIRPFFTAEFIDDMLLTITLNEFLKQCFIVFAIIATFYQIEISFQLVKDKGTGLTIGMIDIYGATTASKASARILVRVRPPESCSPRPMSM